MYKNAKDWKCKYCGFIIKSRAKFYEHLKTCKEKLKFPHDSLGRIINYDSHIKRVKTFKQHIKDGTVVPWNKGKSCTPEHRAHIAEGTKRYLQSTGNYYGARFSKTACEFIDELNKKNNWHLQHALNGGETPVGPYYLDGYDKELNIAFEYDEPQHYINAENNTLTERDISRMKYIKEQLHCEFYRYNEKKQVLYKC